MKKRLQDLKTTRQTALLRSLRISCHGPTEPPENDTDFKSNVRLEGLYWEDGENDYAERAVLCYDKGGNLWVSDTATCRVLRFDSDGNHDGAVIAWAPKTYAMAVDPNEPDRVFNGYLEYEVSYVGDLFSGDSTWKLVNYWGHEQPRGNDIHTGIWSVHRYSNGKRYAVTFDAVGVRGRVAYFDETVIDSETGQTTGILKDTKILAGDRFGLEDVIESDGSVLRLSKSGTPVTAHFHRYNFNGFDTDGVTPLFQSTEVGSVEVESSDPVKDIWRWGDGKILTFWNNGMITMTTPYAGWHLGAVDPATDAWLWKTCPTGLADRLGTFEKHQPSPQDVPFCVIDDNIFTVCRGEFYRGDAQINQILHFRTDGTFLGQLGTPRIQGSYPLAPGAHNNLHTLGVVKVDGTIYIYLTEEDCRGIHRWKVLPE